MVISICEKKNFLSCRVYESIKNAVLNRIHDVYAFGLL